MKILISAAEASSDAHGAKLLETLRALTPIEAFGIGGPQLKAAGLRQLVDARELLAMGFGEILGRLPKIRAALQIAAAEAAREKPDVAVLIDYPDFHFRLARKLRESGIPVIYYIPPKVWAWRQGRVKLLRERFAKILCIFPFENEFYRKHQVPVSYVGNPLADELPTELTREQAREKLGIGADEKVLLLMPGSRPAELKAHTELFLKAARGASQKLGKLRILMPWALTTERGSLMACAKEFADLNVRISQGDAHLCMVAADAGLVKSGTSTLEAALLGCPHAVVYRTSALTRVIFKTFIRYGGPVGMVNLVAHGPDSRERLMREILLEQVTVENLTEEAIRLLSDTETRDRIKAGISELKRKVLFGEGSTRLRPSESAAREVMDLVSTLKERK